MGALSRLLTGNPKCCMCRKDGPWTLEGRQYCDEHKQQMNRLGVKNKNQTRGKK